MSVYERLKLISEKIAYYKQNGKWANHIKTLREYQRGLLNENIQR